MRVFILYRNISIHAKNKLFTGFTLRFPTPQQSAELKTHFSDATCHVDDNVSKHNYTKCDFKRLQMSLCMILIPGAAWRSVSVPAGRQHQPFPESACAWLHWLGVTSRVRGQFGVTRGSSVLSNKTAGPPDWIRPVSWQQAPPPYPYHESTRSVVIETAGLHSLFISFNSSVPITWPRRINPNNRNRGSPEHLPLSTQRAIKQNVQFALFWVKTILKPKNVWACCAESAM